MPRKHVTVRKRSTRTRRVVRKVKVARRTGGQGEAHPPRDWSGPPKLPETGGMEDDPFRIG